MKRWLAALLILTLTLPALAEDLPEPEPIMQQLPEDEPTEDAPAEEEPTEEEPSEEEPTEDEPTEDVPTEDAPTEDAPTEDTPTEDAPTEDAPLEEVPFEIEPLEDEAVPEEEAAPYTAAQIEQIQNWLIALKYLEEGRATGEYDAETASAVSAFQSDNGLNVTGECDETTYALLKQLGQEALDAEGGETGDDDGDEIDVTQIQAWLFALGYLDESQRTGEYDEATDAAVRRFQADNALEVTGECDPVTLALLSALADAAGREETGYTAEQLRQIQTWLIALGYLRAESPTGTLDEATTAAIRAFQGDVLLEEIGRAHV